MANFDSAGKPLNEAVCCAGLNGGRIESLLVSFPPLVAWNYKVVPKEGSQEDALLHVLRQPRDWVQHER